MATEQSVPDALTVVMLPMVGAIDALTDEDLTRAVAIRSEPHTVPLDVTRAVGHRANHAGQLMLISLILAGAEGWDWATIAAGGREEIRQETGSWHAGVATTV